MLVFGWDSDVYAYDDGVLSNLDHSLYEAAAIQLMGLVAYNNLGKLRQHV